AATAASSAASSEKLGISIDSPCRWGRRGASGAPDWAKAGEASRHAATALKARGRMKGSGRSWTTNVKPIRRFAATTRRRCSERRIRAPLAPEKRPPTSSSESADPGLSRPDGADFGPPGLKPSAVRGQIAGRLNLAECQKDDP